MGKKLTADRLIQQKQLTTLLKELRREKDSGSVKFTTDYYAIALASSTGLRISEMAALEWGDVHEHMLIVQRGKGAKKRDVFFGDRVQKLFDEYRIFYEANFGAVKPTSRLFIGKRGPLTRSGLHQRWLYWKLRLGLPKGITFHSLRHYSATYLLDSGVPLASVRDWLGHSNIATTSTYLWHTQEAKLKLISVL